MASCLACEINPDGSTTSGTHATLALTTATSANFTLSLDVRTDNQLPGNSAVNTPPNPWETAWVMFRYVDRDHYDWLYLGTNHYERGKKDTLVNGQIEDRVLPRNRSLADCQSRSLATLDLTVIGITLSWLLTDDPY
ncbi:MAG: hypothetical protein M3Z35_16710 [Nitrospirota bacterium]|nr:hypothetical protein [Nitrospirota bacterium]